MKKIFLFILFFLLTLMACSTDESNNSRFIGKVSDKFESSYTIKVLQGEILSSGDSVSISSDLNYEIGDLIEVEYTGSVMESYPLQVNVINLNKILFSGTINKISNQTIYLSNSNENISIDVEIVKDFSVNDKVYVIERNSLNYLEMIK